MNGLFKKLASFALVFILGTLCACGDPTSESQGESESVVIPEIETPNYTTEDYDFAAIYTNDKNEVWTFGKYNEYLKHEGENIRLAEVHTRVNDKNYLKIDLETDVDLVGFINYHNAEDKTQTNSEKFFIKACEERKMIQLKIVTVGTLKEDYLKEALSEYKKRLSQYANAESPMISMLSGITMLTRFAQPKNAVSPMTFAPSSTTIFARFSQYANTPDSRTVTLLGISTSVRLSQP